MSTTSRRVVFCVVVVVINCVEIFRGTVEYMGCEGREGGSGGGGKGLGAVIGGLVLATVVLGQAAEEGASGVS